MLGIRWGSQIECRLLRVESVLDPQNGGEKMRRLLGVGLLAMGIIGLPWAKTVKEEKVKEETGQGQNNAPEINPNQAVSALTLLSGGLLVLRRKKNS
jgi:LPXTG-motif cell wall-anchored protein